MVIGAGNRSQDGAIVKTMSTALINRMFHVQLIADPQQWIDWAYENELHPCVIDYITQRPDHLFSEPPKTEEPYSTPRSRHMLSDALRAYGAGEKDVPENILRVLAYGSVSSGNAGMFHAFVKNVGNKDLLNRIIKGDARFPSDPKDRDQMRKKCKARHFQRLRKRRHYRQGLDARSQ